MSPAEVLLIELRSAGITVYLDPVGELRCRSRRGVLTPELRRRVAEHKRVEAMRALAGDDGTPPAAVAAAATAGDVCETCGEAHVCGRVPRCVLCALAAMQLSEDRQDRQDLARESAV